MTMRVTACKRQQFCVFVILILLIALSTMADCDSVTAPNTPPVSAKSLWRVSLPSTFASMVTNDKGDRLLVGVENHPGKNGIIMFGADGKELWKVISDSGKLQLGGMSSDAKTVVVYGYEKKANGENETFAAVYNGDTGTIIDRISFKAPVFPLASISAVGNYILCYDPEQTFIALYQLENQHLRELWKITKETDGLPFKLGSMEYGTIFSDGSGVLLSNEKGSIVSISRAGKPSWKIDTKSYNQMNPGCTISQSGLLTAYGNNQSEWQGNPQAFAQDEVALSYLQSFERNIGIYKTGTTEFGLPVIKPFTGISWEYSNENALGPILWSMSDNIGGVINNVSVFKTCLQVTTFQPDGTVKQTKRLLQGSIGDNSISIDLATKQKIFAVLTPNPTENNSTIRVCNFDGDLCWESKLDDLTYADFNSVKFSNDGKKMYATAGMWLYAFAINKE